MAPAVLQGIIALGQLVGGKLDKERSERLHQKLAAKAQSRRNTVSSMVGSSLNDPLLPGGAAMMDRADVSAANAISSADQYGNPMAALGAIMGQQQKAYQDIGIASAKDQKDDLLRLIQVMQGNNDQELAMNMGYYSDKYNEGREQIGAGFENLYGAFASGLGGFFQKTPKAPKLSELFQQFQQFQQSRQ